MCAVIASLASYYALPIAVAAGTTLLGAAAAKWRWSSKSADLELDKDISHVSGGVLSRSLAGPTLKADHVGSGRDGHTGVTSRVTAEVGPTVVLTTENHSGVTAVMTAQTHEMHETEEIPGDGMLFVRVPQPDEKFDEEHIERYLNAGKAQMVFSTDAMQGKGFSRSVDLNKKVDDEEVPDNERQHKVDVQFAKIKHAIGVGGREGMPNKAISYSVTWNFIQVYNRSGEPPVKYDLVNKADIKRLLEDQGIDNIDDAMINSVFTKLLSINREIKTLTEREVGKTKDCFLHDFEGNPNGLELFRPFSPQDGRVKDSSKHGKYGDTMEEFEFLKKRGGKFFGEYQVNQRGAEVYSAY